MKLYGNKRFSQKRVGGRFNALIIFPKLLNYSVKDTYDFKDHSDEIIKTNQSVRRE